MLFRELLHRTTWCREDASVVGVGVGVVPYFVYVLCFARLLSFVAGC